MPAREFVLNDGQLSVVVKTFETVELAQVEAEVKSLEEAQLNALETLGNTDPTDAEALATNAKAHAESKAALDNCKSELQVASGLVAQPDSAVPTEEVDSLEEGGATEQAVHVPVEG